MTTSCFGFGSRSRIATIMPKPNTTRIMPTTIRPPGMFGVEGTADRIGLAAVGVAGAAIAAHAAVSAIRQASSKTRNDRLNDETVEK